jgi:hypothetical protein
MKSRIQNLRIPTAHCDESGSSYTTLLLHTEVHWLPRDRILVRIFTLRSGIWLFSVDHPFQLSSRPCDSVALEVSRPSRYFYKDRKVILIVCILYRHTVPLEQSYNSVKYDKIVIFKRFFLKFNLTCFVHFCWHLQMLQPFNFQTCPFTMSIKASQVVKTDIH